MPTTVCDAFSGRAGCWWHQSSRGGVRNRNVGAIFSGVEQLEARWAHNSEVASSSLAPATISWSEYVESGNYEYSRKART